MPRRPLDGPRRITGNAASHAEYKVGPATDYGADMREVVRAPFGGWVTRWWSTTGGNSVAITNNQAKFTLQHMSAYAGKSAGQVNEGDVIGYVGNTGTATTGPHVHCWIVLVESGRRVSFEQYLVDQGWTTAPLESYVPGPFQTSTAGDGGVPIPPAPKRRKKSMSTGYFTTRNGKTEWALGGESPGTPANWITLSSQDLANEVAAVHGSFVGLSNTSYDSFRDRYLSPLSISGGVTGGSTDLKPVLDAVAGIPAAVRANLIKE